MVLLVICQIDGVLSQNLVEAAVDRSGFGVLDLLVEEGLVKLAGVAVEVVEVGQKLGVQVVGDRVVGVQGRGCEEGGHRGGILFTLPTYPIFSFPLSFLDLLDYLQVNTQQYPDRQLNLLKQPHQPPFPHQIHHTNHQQPLHTSNLPDRYSILLVKKYLVDMGE